MRLVQHLPQKAYRAEAEAVHRYVRDHVRYVRDIRGVETLHPAPWLLSQRAGDCDDKSVLTAALCEAIGHKTRLVAVGFKPWSYQHVYPEVELAGRWVALETTEPWALGRVPRRKPLLRMVQTV